MTYRLGLCTEDGGWGTPCIQAEIVDMYTTQKYLHVDRSRPIISRRRFNFGPTRVGLSANICIRHIPYVVRGTVNSAWRPDRPHLPCQSLFAFCLLAWLSIYHWSPLRFDLALYQICSIYDRSWLSDRWFDDVALVLIYRDNGKLDAYSHSVYQLEIFIVETKITPLFFSFIFICIFYFIFISFIFFLFSLHVFTEGQGFVTSSNGRPVTVPLVSTALIKQSTSGYFCPRHPSPWKASFFLFPNPNGSTLAQSNYLFWWSNGEQYWFGLETSQRTNLQKLSQPLFSRQFVRHRRCRNWILSCHMGISIGLWRVL